MWLAKAPWEPTQTPRDFEKLDDNFFSDLLLNFGLQLCHQFGSLKLTPFVQISLRLGGEEWSDKRVREWVESENESNRLVVQILFHQGNCVQDQLVQCVRMYPAHPSLNLLLYDRAVGGDLKSSSQLFWIKFWLISFFLLPFYLDGASRGIDVVHIPPMRSPHLAHYYSISRDHCRVELHQQHPVLRLITDILCNHARLSTYCLINFSYSLSDSNILPQFQHFPKYWGWCRQCPSGYDDIFWRLLLPPNKELTPNVLEAKAPK